MEGFINEINPERTVLRGWLRPAPDNSSAIVLRIGDLNAGMTTLSPPSEALLDLKGDSVADFSLTLEQPLQLGALADGSVGIRYEQNHPGTEVLPTERLRLHEVSTLSKWAAGFDSGLREKLLTALGSTSLPAGAQPPQENYQSSYIEFPVGLEAADGSVKLGRDGYLFPLGGSNSILQRFQAKDGTPEHATQMREVEKWRELLRVRGVSSRSVGAHFRQIILPDKITALPHLAPVDLTTPTPAYSALHSHLSGSEAYVDTLSLFREWSEAHSPWLRADAHFSARAAQRVAAELLVSLSLEVPELLEAHLDMLVAREGDLGRRFFGIPILDHRAEPAIDRLSPGKAPSTELVRKPIEGRNKVSRWMGAHQVSRSSSAPIDASLMVFGTSSSNLGTVPNQLSWWLSRIFREYHVVWLPEIEFDRAEEFGVDIIVGQTVERFLSRIPVDVPPVTG